MFRLNSSGYLGLSFPELNSDFCLVYQDRLEVTYRVQEASDLSGLIFTWDRIQLQYGFISTVLSDSHCLPLSAPFSPLQRPHLQVLYLGFISLLLLSKHAVFKQTLT